MNIALSARQWLIALAGLASGMATALLLLLLVGIAVSVWGALEVGGGGPLEALGIVAALGGVMLFGVPTSKDEIGSGAIDPDGILNVAIRGAVSEVGGKRRHVDRCRGAHLRCDVLERGGCARGEHKVHARAHDGPNSHGDGQECDDQVMHV